MRGAFVSDYRPTKRIGIDELDGCLNLLVHRLEEVADNGETGGALYMGALIALETIRYGNFEYPHEFMEVYENRVRELEGER